MHFLNHHYFVLLVYCFFFFLFTVFHIYSHYSSLFCRVQSFDTLFILSLAAEKPRSGGDANEEELPPPQVDFNRDTGEKRVVEYELDDDGNRVKVCTYTVQYSQNAYLTMPIINNACVYSTVHYCTMHIVS